MKSENAGSQSTEPTPALSGRISGATLHFANDASYKPLRNVEVVWGDRGSIQVESWEDFRERVQALVEARAVATDLAEAACGYLEATKYAAWEYDNARRVLEAALSEYQLPNGATKVNARAISAAGGPDV